MHANEEICHKNNASNVIIKQKVNIKSSVGQHEPPGPDKRESKT
jgi:hypothetical protein